MKLKCVRVDLPGDVHHRLRIKAAVANKSLAQWVRDLLEREAATAEGKESARK